MASLFAQDHRAATVRNYLCVLRQAGTPTLDDLQAVELLRRSAYATSEDEGHAFDGELVLAGFTRDRVGTPTTTARTAAIRIMYGGIPQPRSTAAFGAMAPAGGTAPTGGLAIGVPGTPGAPQTPGVPAVMTPIPTPAVADPGSPSVLDRLKATICSPSGVAMLESMTASATGNNSTNTGRAAAASTLLRWCRGESMSQDAVYDAACAIALNTDSAPRDARLTTLVTVLRTVCFVRSGGRPTDIGSQSWFPGSGGTGGLPGLPAASSLPGLPSGAIPGLPSGQALGLPAGAASSAPAQAMSFMESVFGAATPGATSSRMMDGAGVLTSWFDVMPFDEFLRRLAANPALAMTLFQAMLGATGSGLGVALRDALFGALAHAAESDPTSVLQFMAPNALRSALGAMPEAARGPFVGTISQAMRVLPGALVEALGNVDGSTEGAGGDDV
jgi:hypothetical protein